MKKLFFVFLILATIGFCSAANVCIIVDYANGEIKTNCLEAKDLIGGEKLLDSSIFDISWSGAGIYGKALCKIDNVGDEVIGDGCKWGAKYWGFYVLKEGNWNYMPVGFSGSEKCWNGDLSSYDGHYCVKDGDILGFKYGGYGIFPNVSNTMLKLNDMAIKVNEKKISVEEGETIKNIKTGSEIEVSADLENLYSEDFEIQVELEIEGILDGEDFKEKSKKVQISAGDSKDLELTFKIPPESGGGEYDFVVLIKGEDGDGASYIRKIEYEIEIETNQQEINNFENVSNIGIVDSDLIINLESEEVLEKSFIEEPKNILFVFFGIVAIIAVFAFILKDANNKTNLDKPDPKVL